LLELFSFHVSREQVRIVQVDAAAAALPDGMNGRQRADTGADAAVRGRRLRFLRRSEDLAGAAGRHQCAGPAGYGRGRCGAAPGRPARSDKGAAGGLESTTLRVSVEKVDQLINLVGELVITQAMLTQQAKELDAVQFSSLLAGSPIWSAIRVTCKRR